MSEVLRTVNEQGLTSCCGAYSTYVEGTECCKACYEEVLSPQPGIEYTLPEKEEG